MLPVVETTAFQLLGLGLILLGTGFALHSSTGYWRRILSQQRLLLDRVNHLLPQTQCGQCGYEGCLPYARAIVQGAAINQCPPGGDATIYRLANLLNELPRPLNPSHGKHEPAKIASIREDECIGCTKCIKACPVDAILGAAKLMHTVISSECTGCDLCVEPCPVDCIDMIPRVEPESWRWRLPTQIAKANSPANPVRETQP